MMGKNSRPLRKTHMGRQKIASILISLFLTLGICANGMMTDACLCGQACLHGIQNNSEEKTNSLIHLRCSETGCKSCNLEKGRSLKSAQNSPPSQHFSCFDAPSLIFVSTDSPSSSKPAIGLFNPFYAFGDVFSAPIYLKNATLLC